MSAYFELDAYLERIGYRGSVDLTMQTLQQIVFCQVTTVSFENLSPLLRLPFTLDAASLFEKMVSAGRGGYCFEQNLLLKYALDAIGFCTTGLSARALWQKPIEAITPRDHMVLLVKLDGEPLVVDIGFGGPTPTGVLKLVPDIEQSTPHEACRLLPLADGYLTQVLIRNEWVTLYRFDLAEQFLPDYEILSWYLSHFPQSIFVNQLFAARATEGGRFALRNNELAQHSLDGTTVRRSITTAEELRTVLEETFLLTLPDVPELMPTFEKNH